MSRKPLRTGYVTKFDDVNEILASHTQGVADIFGQTLIGVYLTGSLSYDAFNYDSSDIDVTVILQNAASGNDIEAISALHGRLQQTFRKWAERFECSYTPIGMLSSVLPPKDPRPWYWGTDDVLYSEAIYGNEWIIGNYLLYQHAIPLVGPSFRELTGPVNIEDVQRACIRDLFVEWERKAVDRAWFTDSHHEVYYILNMCRILYTVMCRDAGSKKTAAAWVKDHYGEPWRSLVAKAEQWRYGLELGLQQEAIEFLRFVTDRVLETQLAEEMADDLRALRQPNR